VAASSTVFSPTSTATSSADATSGASITLSEPLLDIYALSMPTVASSAGSRPTRDRFYGAANANGSLPIIPIV
jgi:hypothetical protein